MPIILMEAYETSNTYRLQDMKISWQINAMMSSWVTSRVRMAPFSHA
jgi:hypothetical protein